MDTFFHNRFIAFLLLLFVSPIIYGQSNQIDSLISILKSDTNQIAIKNEIAELLITVNPKQAIHYAKQALQSSIQENDRIQKSKATRILLEAYIRDKDIESLNKIQAQATQFTDQNSTYEKGNALFCKGMLHYKSSAYSDASVDFFEALKYYEKSKSSIEYCKTLKYIGISYYSQYAPIKALKYYKKALACSIKNNFQHEIAAGYNNVASVYHFQEKYLEAIDYFKKSLEIAIKNNDIYLQSINYINLGIVETSQKHLENALSYFKKAIDISKNNYPNLTAATYNSLARYFIETNQPDSTIYYALKSLKIPNNQINNSIQSTEILKNTYLEKKDTSMAFQYEVENRMLTDSFTRINNLMKTNFTELEYNLQKKENQLKYENNVAKLIYAVSILLAILLGLGAHSVFNRLRTKIKTIEKDKRNIEKDLTLKNKELTSKAMFLVQKNETMNQISEELNALFKNMKNESNRVQAKKIVAKLKKNTNEEVWKEFELYFQSVHTNFYRNLQKDFPNLTSNEKKLSAFLCMNMTSKEISAITGQRIATLEVARSRLRKKLGIAKQDVSLPNFLGRYV